MGSLKDNDISSRMTHKTGQGFAHTTPKEVMHGTPEEISARVGGSFRTMTDNAATHFTQIGPAGSGGTLNRKSVDRKSGNAKFGNPRRYA